MNLKGKSIEELQIIHKQHPDLKIRTAACAKIYQLKNPQKFRDIAKKTYYKHKEHYKEYKKQYALENKEKIAEYQKEYREETKKERSIYQRQYRHENPEKYGSAWLRYGLKKKQRTLFDKWDELETVYNNCPDDKVVDHIIPLNGKDVSGLHVPWNLQYLTPEQNNTKLHKFDGTYDNNSWKLKK